MKFVKMQGAGNDYVYVDCFKYKVNDPKKVARIVSDRHFGIGADGLLILKYVANMPFMFYYNSDGSQAPMCGNGIRCFAFYLKNNNVEQEDTFTVKTLSGDLTIETKNENDTFFVKVNMGEPIFDVKKLINIEKERFMREKITIDEKEIEISYVFMGTDHSVIFVNDFSDYDIDDLGKKIENYTEIFPKKVNVNFVKVIDRSNIEVITWERGAGRTLACGTGATASAVLARIYGFVEDRINVKVPGGKLVIDYAGYGSEAFMTGSSEKIAEGYYVFKR